MAHVISDRMCKLRSLRKRMSSRSNLYGADHMQIDASACVDCGACESACPTGAISAE